MAVDEKFPHDVDVINYDEYERLRADALPASSISANQKYTARVMFEKKHQSREQYAFELGALVSRVIHKEAYSLINYQLIAERRLGTLRDEGITTGGIIFLRRPMPTSLTEMPHRNEIGYFTCAGDPFDNFLHAITEKTMENTLNEHLVLT